MKKINFIIVILGFLFLPIFSTNTMAYEEADFFETVENIDITNPPTYAIGWQYSRPASGISLRIPIEKNFDLQPVFAISMVEKDTKTNGRYAVGIRGIYNLTDQDDFHPYTGLSIGHQRNFSNKTGKSISSTGVEVFFGVEYRKYLIRPAFEIGMGNYHQSDGTHYAGLSYSLSLQYYF